MGKGKDYTGAQSELDYLWKYDVLTQYMDPSGKGDRKSIEMIMTTRNWNFFINSHLPFSTLFYGISPIPVSIDFPVTKELLIEEPVVNDIESKNKGGNSPAVMDIGNE